MDKCGFVGKSGFVDKNEFLAKIGLEDNIGLEENIDFVDKVEHVEDSAERVFERVEDDDDDDDCTSNLADAFGINVLEDTYIIGSLSHTGDRAPMLDSGSILHIAPLSYGSAYPLTPDPLARPAEVVTGGSLQRFGRRRIMTEMQEGRRVTVNHAIGNLHRPILSVP